MAGLGQWLRAERREWKAVGAEDAEANSNLSCLSSEVCRVLLRASWQLSQLRWTLTPALWEVCIFEKFP